MIHNLKILALALGAVFAMSAVMASGASAAAVNFTAASAPATVTGADDEGKTGSFNTDGGVVTCDATYHGTLASTSQATLTVTPTYTNCTALGGLASATITMNGCDYVFHAGDNATGQNEGSVDVVCELNKDITVDATSLGTSKCVVHVEPQTGLKEVTYTDVGTGTTTEVTVDVNLSGIKYTQTAGTGFGACATTTTTSNGTLTAKALVTGETDTGTTHVAVSVD